MSDKKLRPCPFCGCKDRRVGIRRMGKKGYRVICGRCGGGGPYITINDFDNKDQAQETAKEVWNGKGLLE